MPNPLVSVLLPVFNGGRYLDGALRTIACQTIRDLEIVIIDDGSTDDTASIIQRWAVKDRRIRALKNENNLGLIATLNLGLSRVRGDFVARMDADDECHPRRIEKQVNAMWRDPQVDVCGTWVARFNDLTADIVQYPTTDANIRCDLIRSCPLAHPSVMMRRATIERLGLRYDPARLHAEDLALWATHRNDLVFANLPLVLTRLRKHADQVSHRFRAQQKATSAGIRRDLFVELGVDVTTRDSALHEAIISGEVEQDIGTLRSVDRWLRRLAKANHSRRSFPEPEFITVLGDLWAGACRRVSPHRARTYFVWESSPLARRSQMTWSHRMSIAGRSLLPEYIADTIAVPYRWLRNRLPRNGS